MFIHIQNYYNLATRIKLAREAIMAVAIAHSTIGEFNSNFIANDVTVAKKKRPILLSACGASTYQLIRNLVSPGKPTNKLFDEIIKLVKDHFGPIPSVTFQQCSFNTRKQKEGESIAARKRFGDAHHRRLKFILISTLTRYLLSLWW